MMLAPGGKMRRKQLGQIKGCRHAHGQSRLELLIGAFPDAAHHGRRIVHQHIHMTVAVDHLPGESLQGVLIGNIADIMGPFRAVDDADMGAVLFKLLRDALADAAGAAGDDDYFILEHGFPSLLLGYRFFKIHYSRNPGK